MNCMICRENVNAVAAGSSTSHPALSARVRVPPFCGVVAVLPVLVGLDVQLARRTEASAPTLATNAQFDRALNSVPLPFFLLSTGPAAGSLQNSCRRAPTRDRPCTSAHRLGTRRFP